MQSYVYTDATGQRWLWPPWLLNGSLAEAWEAENEWHWRTASEGWED